MLLRAVLGIEPGGTVHLRPLRPFPFVRLTLEGMSLAGGRLRLTVDREGAAVTEGPDGLTLTVDEG